MAAHKGLATMRLGQEGVQEWLNQNNDNIMTKVGMKPNLKNKPSNGDEWQWKHISSFTKQFLSNMYGIDCVKGGTKRGRDGKPKRDAVGFVCAVAHTDKDGNVFKCSGSNLMKVSPQSLEGMLSLVHSHLYNPANDDPAESQVRDAAKQVVNRAITDNGFKQILQQFIEAPVPVAPPPLPVAVPVPVPAPAPAQENEYEDPGFGEFEDNYGGYDNTDLYQDNPYQPDRIDEIIAIEENHHGNNEAGGEAENNMGDTSALEQLREYRSISAKALDKRMVLAQQQLWGGSDEKREIQSFHRRTIVNKYTGINPYMLDAIDFILLLQGSEYQGYIERYLNSS
jgi:hypothetical protein